MSLDKDKLELLNIFKALSNETRLNILEWLREPEKHFQKGAFLSEIKNDKYGVCVGDIQEKAQLSQSTISNYLKMLQNAGLLEFERLGQWTYYRRNEKNIQLLSDIIKDF
ncbi:ArsR/SmtB family transcription factor [Priestia megaterium]|uniref:ArsR/SmtB family transcription factor n=1 Tax=Priestia megaterium TaxID=1404 RepID=UPI003A7FBA78